MCFLQKSPLRRPDPPAPLLQQNTYNMDKQSKLLVCAAFIALLATTVHAQRNIVKLTPFPVLGKLGFQYERQIAGQYSVEVEWQHWEVQRKKSSSFFFSACCTVRPLPMS